MWSKNYPRCQYIRHRINNFLHKLSKIARFSAKPGNLCKKTYRKVFSLSKNSIDRHIKHMQSISDLEASLRKENGYNKTNIVDLVKIRFEFQILFAKTHQKSVAPPPKFCWRCNNLAVNFLPNSEKSVKYFEILSFKEKISTWKRNGKCFKNCMWIFWSFCLNGFRSASATPA